MDDGEAQESAVDGEPSAAVGAMSPDTSRTQESAQPTKKQKKRKRSSTESDLIYKEAAAVEWRQEMDELFEYYKEVTGIRLYPEELGLSTSNSIIACLLEESSLPYTKLKDEIHKQIKFKSTLASVGKSIYDIGQRSMYGIFSENADVMEDESESSLWCWETRDLKIFPSHIRGSLKVRRMARKKIQERILALSENLSAMETPKVHGSQKTEFVNVGKVLNLDSIRSLVEKLKQKNDADMARKEIKKKEQELQISIRNAAKEQKKMDSQVQKEQKQKERELKRMKETVEKEAKRVDREKAEQAKLKVQAAIQKQASIMERFLKCKKSNSNEQRADYIRSVKTADPNSSKIDGILLSQESFSTLEDILKSHITAWKKSSHHNRLWGVRRGPKIQLFKELKLQKYSEALPFENMSTSIKVHPSHMDNSGSLNFSKPLDELTPYDENDAPSINAHGNTSSSVQFVKKLLQFDGSHRPAYYGTWTKKSSVIGPRHPFKEDPTLNYNVDSDEEWEEEEPGESLSDDEENMKEDNFNVDEEEETEDSFVVPDDYLSEDEGVQSESPSGKLDEYSIFQTIPGVAVEELNHVQEQQKVLHRLTEGALQKGCPLVISNLDQGEVGLPKSEDLTGRMVKLQLCLQALHMREYPGAPIIDVPAGINLSTENQEIYGSNKKGPSTPIAFKSISDSDLPDFVKLVTSHHCGSGKLVELLHKKFPCVSKVQLGNKLREIAEFTNSRWQVKKDILDRFGFSGSPDKGGQSKGIAQYFSKRCLPPEDSSKSAESSQSGMKSKVGKDQVDAGGLVGGLQPSDP